MGPRVGQRRGGARLLTRVGSKIRNPEPYSDSAAAAKERKTLIRFTRRKSVMALSLDLQDFILRARVLKLYRLALRTARRAPGHTRAELARTIRQEMENNRNCRDKQRIRFLISEGLGKLKGLDEMLDMQGH
ncbi:hypothetical protein ACSBR1_029366 [Camellia fascicularis]